MQPHAIVSQLEATFLPLLNQAIGELTRDFPRLVFRVWSSSTGSETSYQGHDLGIECKFPDAQSEETNCVAMEVGIWHIAASPEFNSFGVVWCHGNAPSDSDELLDRPIPVSPQSLSQLATAFPNLEAAFRRAIDAWTSRSSN